MLIPLAMEVDSNDNSNPTLNLTYKVATKKNKGPDEQDDEEADGLLQKFLDKD